MDIAAPQIPARESSNTHFTQPTQTHQSTCTRGTQIQASTNTLYNKMTTRVTLFEDIFEVGALNPEGKKFDRVNRIQAIGTTFDCSLLLDTNSEIYPIWENDKLTMVLASTLHLDGTPDDHRTYNPSSNAPSMADNFEYVMHGRVFNMEYKGEGIVAISASFGGLLMLLTGDQRHLSNVHPDMRLYVLLKKD